MLRSAIYRSVYMAVLFLAGLVLANISLPSIFGSVSLLLINAAIVSLVTGLGTESLMMHALANKKWSFAYAFSFMWRSLFFQLFLFLLLQSLFIYFGNKTLLSQSPARYFVVELIYFSGLVFTEKYLALFYSLQGATLANKLLLFSSLLYLFLLTALSHIFGFGFSTILYMIAFQSFAQGCILIAGFHLKEKVSLSERINWNEILKAFKVSSVVMITNIIQFFAYRIDFWLIETYHSHYEVGIYAQANKCAQLMWVMPNIFAMLLIPKFSQIDKDHMPVVFKLAALSNLVIAAGTLIFSNILYAHFLAPQYYEGIPALYLMTPGYFCWSLVIYFGAYCSWSGRFAYNLICSSFCLAVIFAADLLLIPRYSIQGAAIANTMAYSATLLLYLFLYKRALCKVPGLKLVSLGKKDLSILKQVFK